MKRTFFVRMKEVCLILNSLSLFDTFDTCFKAMDNSRKMSEYLNHSNHLGVFLQKFTEEGSISSPQNQDIFTSVVNFTSLHQSFSVNEITFS